MNTFVGVTDRDWFDLLSSQEHLDDVNFWQPSGNNLFRALQPGELFLFKLHYPENYIVGGGFFAHSTLLPVSLAWEAFGINNGAQSLPEMRTRVAKYRKQNSDRTSDYTVGCILLEQPFFLPRAKWITAPSSWAPSIVQGRGYDLSVEPGLTIWNQLQSRSSSSLTIKEELARYGEPVISYPRLGQGSFRVLVTDVYQRRCAITNERTLPALDAAHIKPYSCDGLHTINNGVLLRRDLHALFDKGYITITPSLTVEVSKKIKEEFENGKDYYRHHGNPIRLPINYANRPAGDFLAWHNQNIFKG